MSYDKELFCIKMRTQDNPFNSPEAIARVKAMCRDETEIAIRLDGEFRARGGSVYKMWRDEKPWVLEPFDVPESEGLLLMAIDPHPSTPHAILWTWIDFEGWAHPLFKEKPNCYAVAEFSDNGHVPYIVSMIEVVEKTVIKRKHDVAICDPAGWIVNQHETNAKSFVQQLEDNGIFPQKGSKDLAGGIIKTGEMLSLNYNSAWDDNADELVEITREYPQYMIFDRCEQLRWEIRQYRWPTRRGRSKDEKAKPERPIDKDDHMVENQRRTCEFVYDGKFNIYDQVEAYRRLPKIVVNGQEVDANFDEIDNDFDEIYNPI